MKRDPYFDNLKFLLILLVVVGHVITPLMLKNHLPIKSLYLWIYTFHMPLFMFIAGYFAKPQADIGGISKTLTRYFIPYLIFQYLHYLHTGSGSFSLFSPEYAMWFLLTLTYFHLLLPVFTKHLRLAIILFMVASLVAGDISNIGTCLSLSRTIFLMPFFLTGYLAKVSNISFGFTTKTRLLSYCVMLSVAVLAIAFTPTANHLILAGNGPCPFATRIGVYLTMAVMCFCFLAVVPHRKTIYTQLGGRTMYVYLLHGFVLNSVFVLTDSPLLLIGGTVLLTFALSSNLVKSITWPLIEPSKLFAQTSCGWLVEPHSPQPRPQQQPETPAPSGLSVKQ